MLQLNCPFCGLRDEAEFSCGGEAHIARPLARNQLSDKDFADYLFLGLWNLMHCMDPPKHVMTS